MRKEPGKTLERCVHLALCAKRLCSSVFLQSAETAACVHELSVSTVDTSLSSICGLFFKSLSLNPQDYKYQMISKQSYFGYTCTRWAYNCFRVAAFQCVCIQLKELRLIWTYRKNSIPRVNWNNSVIFWNRQCLIQ